MEIKQTIRGFNILHFLDGNSEKFTLQEPSACRDEGMIWLGAELELKVMGTHGWKVLDLDSIYGKTNWVGIERMHLTQTQVKDLLPYLTYFVENGVLPDGTI